VYVDGAAAVVKYNLVFIHPGLCQQDNGRVPGYDNAHGHHERHWMGSVQPVGFIHPLRNRSSHGQSYHRCVMQ
jgi:hypothetical protein